MEVYRRATLHIIEQYLDSAISFSECISALDEALAAVFPPPTGEDLDSLRALVRWNRRIVITEFERRTSEHN
jgi:hypothetical protein